MNKQFVLVDLNKIYGSWVSGWEPCSEILFEVKDDKLYTIHAIRWRYKDATQTHGIKGGSVFCSFEYAQSYCQTVDQIEIDQYIQKHIVSLL